MGDTRHNKNKPTEIKMTVKVSLEEWRKVHKIAETSGKEASSFIRDLIVKATEDCQLSIKDLEIISQRLYKNLGRSIDEQN